MSIKPVKPKARYHRGQRRTYPRPQDMLISQYMFKWSIEGMGFRLPRRRRRATPPAPPALVWVVRATEADASRTPRTVATDVVSWLTVQVTRHYRHPGAWVVQAPPILDSRVLSSVQIEDAKVEAVALVRDALENALLHIDR